MNLLRVRDLMFLNTVPKSGLHTFLSSDTSSSSAPRHNLSCRSNNHYCVSRHPIMLWAADSVLVWCRNVHRRKRQLRLFVAVHWLLARVINVSWSWALLWWRWRAMPFCCTDRYLAELGKLHRISMRLTHRKRATLANITSISVHW